MKSNLDNIQKQEIMVEYIERIAFTVTDIMKQFVS